MGEWAYDNKFVLKRIRGCCPRELFEDELDTLFEVQSAKVETLNPAFCVELTGHLDGECNTVLLYDLVIMLNS